MDGDRGQYISGSFNKNVEGKLEWMYKGPNLLNREEYLLGRALDKNFEQLDAAEKFKKSDMFSGVINSKNHVEHECIPFSIRTYKSIESAEQVDLQRKLMEDPVEVIKQKEIESRRKILENPVKLKQLHRLVNAAEPVIQTKKLKDKTKRRKKTSSSDEESLNGLLIEKLKKVSSFKKNSNSLRLKLKTFLRNGITNNQVKDKRDKYKANTSDDSGFSNIQNCGEEKDKDCTYNRKSKRNMNDSKLLADCLGNEKEYDRDERINKTSSNSSKHIKHFSVPGSGQGENEKNKIRLTKEEKTVRLQQMIKDANCREQERLRRVVNYRDEYKKEEKLAIKYDHNFINKEVQKVISSNQNSVELRIKSNINNIQRDTHSMSCSFVKRYK